MAGQGYVQVPADSVGKKIDCVSLTASGQSVMRQVVILSGGGSGDSQNYVTVVNGALTVGGNINAISRTACVTGSIALIAGTANIGSINNISATVTVQGNIGISSMPNVNISTMPAVVLAAGANNIGFINGISATVNVAGTFTIGTIDKISAPTVLAAGTANIGSINNISATIAAVLAAGTANIGTINNISASVTIQGNVNISTMPAVNISVMPAITGTVNISGSVALAAGAANIGTINNISAAVVLAAGSANIGTINGISAAVALAAGAANIGFINNISAAVRTYQGPLAVPSASHGPKVVTLSTSAAVALVAAPGAALSIYVDSVLVTNGSGTLTRVDIYDASNTAAAVFGGFAAASGGGWNTGKLDPPAKISANTALNVRCKPNASDVIITINFHVEA